MKLIHGIPNTHGTEYPIDFALVWTALSSPLYRVVDEEGGSLGDIRVRHLIGKFWLSVSAVDGHSVLDDCEIEDACLVAAR